MADDEGCHIIRGLLTVCASSCKVYKVTAKFNMYTFRYRVVYIYNNTHAYLSDRRVCKHVLVAPIIFPGSALPGVKNRKKRQVSGPIEALALPCILRNVSWGVAETGCPRKCGCLSNDHGM